MAEGTPIPVPARRRPVSRDWTARARTTVGESMEYSRFVAVMKRALPIAASVIVAVVLIYAFIPRQQGITMVYERLGQIENDLAMMKPKLTGTDEHGNPFVITADHAVQDARDPHRARLYNVEADITLDRGQWLNATATKGAFDMDAGSLNLTDGISLFSDSGYELHTARGNVDLRRGLFNGPVAVNGQGPLGNFRADGFQIDQKKRMIYLNGNVLMTFYAQHSTAAH